MTGSHADACLRRLTSALGQLILNRETIFRHAEQWLSSPELLEVPERASALDLWSSVVRRALQEGSLERLVLGVLEENPGAQALLEAFQDWQNAAPPPGRVESSTIQTRWERLGIPDCDWTGAAAVRLSSDAEGRFLTVGWWGAGHIQLHRCELQQRSWRPVPEVQVGPPPEFFRLLTTEQGGYQLVWARRDVQPGIYAARCDPAQRWTVTTISELAYMQGLLVTAASAANQLHVFWNERGQKLLRLATWCEDSKLSTHSLLDGISCDQIGLVALESGAVLTAWSGSPSGEVHAQLWPAEAAAVSIGKGSLTGLVRTPRGAILFRRGSLLDVHELDAQTGWLAPVTAAWEFVSDEAFVSVGWRAAIVYTTSGLARGAVRVASREGPNSGFRSHTLACPRVAWPSPCLVMDDSGNMRAFWIDIIGDRLGVHTALCRVGDAWSPQDALFREGLVPVSLTAVAAAGGAALVCVAFAHEAATFAVRPEIVTRELYLVT